MRSCRHAVLPITRIAQAVSVAVCAQVFLLAGGRKRVAPAIDALPRSGARPPQPWALSATALAQRIFALLGALAWSGVLPGDSTWTGSPFDFAEGLGGDFPPPARVFRQTIVPENASLWRCYWDTMVLKKWGNLYVKTSPTTGVVMLLVEKLHPSDSQSSEWTAVDSTLRVQVVNLRNRTVYTLRAQPRIQYTPMISLGSPERARIEQTSWSVVRSAGGDTGERHKTIVASGGTSRSRALRSLFESAMSTGIFTLTYWTFGFWASGIFVAIKVLCFFKVPATISAAFHAAKEVYDFVDHMTMLAGDVRDMHDPGEPDSMYFALGIIAMGIFWLLSLQDASLSPGRGSPASAPSVPSPGPTPRSPRVVGADVSDAESGEEVDPRLKAMEEKQEQMFSMLSRMQDGLGRERGSGSSVSASSGPPTPRGARTVHFNIGTPSASSPSAPPSSLESDPELMSGVERLLSRLKASDQVVGADGATVSTTGAEAGSSPASPVSSSWTQVEARPPGLSISSPGPRTKQDVHAQIRRLESESKNPRDAVLERLRRFQEVDSFQIGGDARVRVAPVFIAKVYVPVWPACHTRDGGVRRLQRLGALPRGGRAADARAGARPTRHEHAERHHQHAGRGGHLPPNVRLDALLRERDARVGLAEAEEPPGQVEIESEVAAARGVRREGSRKQRVRRPGGRHRGVGAAQAEVALRQAPHLAGGHERGEGLSGIGTRFGAPSRKAAPPRTAGSSRSPLVPVPVHPRLQGPFCVPGFFGYVNSAVAAGRELHLPFRQLPLLRQRAREALRRRFAHRLLGPWPVRHDVEMLWTGSRSSRRWPGSPASTAGFVGAASWRGPPGCGPTGRSWPFGPRSPGIFNLGRCHARKAGPRRGGPRRRFNAGHPAVFSMCIVLSCRPTALLEARTPSSV